MCTLAWGGGAHNSMKRSWFFECKQTEIKLEINSRQGAPCCWTSTATAYGRTVCTCMHAGGGHTDRKKSSKDEQQRNPWGQQVC